MCFVFSLLDASFSKLDLLWIFFLNCVFFPLFSDWIRLFKKKWHHRVNEISVLSVGFIVDSKSKGGWGSKLGDLVHDCKRSFNLCSLIEQVKNRGCNVIW